MNSFEIAFLADAHFDEQQPAEFGADSKRNWERVLEHVRGRRFDRIIFGGDIGAETSHPYFAKSLELDRAKVRVIAGNHDTPEGIFRNLPEFTLGNARQLYHSEKIGNYSLLYLDSSSGTIDTAQLEFLRASLALTSEVLVFVHHPILFVDSYVDLHYPLRNRDEILEILLSHPHDVRIFCGHCHTIDFSRHANVRQYIAPAVSYQVVKFSEKLLADTTHFGYRTITLGNDGVSTEVILLE